ncbi:MAG: hydroxyacylglutathione hydrolase [Pseudomonadales bacterium]|nr:hydroxyacylglutathione hydrolase [Pseudomonadales bacterium]
MNISPIPAFTDNYIWQLNDGEQAFVVDPGDAKPVLQFLDENKLKLAGILITHHHWDHTGGIKELLNAWPGIAVYGPNNPSIADITHPLKEGDSINVLKKNFDIYELPGHTLDHIAYYHESVADHDVLFCGDTLFSSGCGRLFEGTAAQMFESLSKLKALPAETLVYCTHEYTEANLAFAAAVEPDNQHIQERIKQVQSLRSKNQPTVPSTLGLELRVNPFLRWDKGAVISSANEQSASMSHEAVEVFAAIRAWKDRF